MRIILTLCCALSLTTLFGQRLEHRLGYMLVQVEKGSSIQDIVSGTSSRFSSPMNLERTISKRLGIYTLQFDFASVSEVKVLQSLLQNDHVLIAQYDHITTLRKLPDDPRFDQQWQWFNTGQTGGIFDSDADAEIAWDFTTGGVNAIGDSIVVAIIDDGIDVNHDDLAANIWYNYNEIEGNGIDDDGNGYIDDVQGWNGYDGDPNVPQGSHGNNVAGMVGAVGNNGIGIAGLNWNVKLMMIYGGSPESSAIASYAYALDQRVLYEQTHGQRGAYVVATNSSWGEDEGQPADAPLWCAFYDSLGVHGILSAGATTNNNANIDIVGDLPTACPSEYLLSVTAVNASNQRTFSGYGIENVDLAAPGEDIYTTRRNNNYTTTSGTSFASPSVAGLIALLYAAPLPSFAVLTHANPALAAQKIRDFIFEGVDHVPSLQSEVKYSGAMNAGTSMLLMMASFNSCPLPEDITADILTDRDVILHWNLDTSITLNARLQTVGSTEWDTLFDVKSPLALTDLLGCQEYLIEFESFCADTTDGFQLDYNFKTEGCCNIPEDIIATVTDDSLHLTWDGVFAANYFIIQYRPEGDTTWIEEATSLQEVILDHLEGCTNYEYRIQTSCDTSESGFSPVYSIRTKGCGACLDQAYCEAFSSNGSIAYIDSLMIGSLINHDGQSTGYVFYDNLDASYIPGETYEVWSIPGFSGQKLFEQYRIWLDANQNGEFENDELIGDKRFLNSDTALNTEIVIPSNALPGSTRMRVSMAGFNPPFSVNQGPCDTISSGEIEDYCVTILPVVNTCPEIDTVFFDAISFTGAFAYWPSVEGSIAYVYRYREVGTTEYTEIATLDTTVNIIDLEKCKTYEFDIRSVCLIDTTSYHTYLLSTDCDVAVKDEIPLLGSFEVYPNPATDFSAVRFVSNISGEHHLAVYNMYGQVLSQQVVWAEAQKETDIRMDDIQKYSAGLYFITIEKDGRIMTKKLVKL